MKCTVAAVRLVVFSWGISSKRSVIVPPKLSLCQNETAARLIDWVCEYCTFTYSRNTKNIWRGLNCCQPCCIIGQAWPHLDRLLLHWVIMVAKICHSLTEFSTWSFSVKWGMKSSILSQWEGDCCNGLNSGKKYIANLCLNGFIHPHLLILLKILLKTNKLKSISTTWNCTEM